MSMRPGKLLQAQRVRQELDKWIDHFRYLLDAESIPRHLDCSGTLCALLVEKLERVTGATSETRAYQHEIAILAGRAIAMWEPAEPARPPVKARPRLVVVEGGQP